MVALHACAFQDVTLPPVRSDAVKTGSRRGDGRQIVVMRPFLNQRPQPRCGMKKNGYNADKANVLCGESPEIMLGDLIVAELTRTGFDVLNDRRQASPSAIVLLGAVQQTFLEQKVNFSTRRSRLTSGSL